jgi:hypothetical protein
MLMSTLNQTYNDARRAVNVLFSFVASVSSTQPICNCIPVTTKRRVGEVWSNKSPRRVGFPSQRPAHAYPTVWPGPCAVHATTWAPDYEPPHGTPAASQRAASTTATNLLQYNFTLSIGYEHINASAYPGEVYHCNNAGMVEGCVGRAHANSNAPQWILSNTPSRRVNSTEPRKDI